LNLCLPSNSESMAALELIFDGGDIDRWQSCTLCVASAMIPLAQERDLLGQFRVHPTVGMDCV
jgi:hypothetical protein